MSPRILSSADLEALSRAVDFMGACDTFITTADMRPIDMAASGARQALESFSLLPGAPFYHFSGSRLHPPAPEQTKRFVAAHKRDGWTESADFFVYGAKAGETTLLLFKPAGASKSASTLWGVLPGTGKLCYKRNLPLDDASAITVESLSLALARHEAEIISSGAEPGRTSSKSPSI
jgi:hypothetical protein